MIEINVIKLKNYASTCSVLYVEDDELIRTQTVSFLGRFFSDIVVAEDGQAGLERYKEREFSVVITDINMPKMNGVEMITAIKELKYEQNIIVTSAHNDSEYLMSLINMNINNFVLKPFNNKQFLYVLYKIAEELSFERERTSLQSKLEASQRMAQSIVEQIAIGIVVIEDGEIVMANNSFLEIGGFASYDVLKLEMPEIGILFEVSKHCAASIKNQEFINELLSAKPEDRKVRVSKALQSSEYQVAVTNIEDSSFVLSFTDITAIHDAMSNDEHTGLASKKFIYEKLEILKQKMPKMPFILAKINHFNAFEKIYGRENSMKLESEFAQRLKEIAGYANYELFVGYFSKNSFVIALPKAGNCEGLIDVIKHANLSASLLQIKNSDDLNEFDLSINTSYVEIESFRTMAQVEIELINSFDMM